MLDIFKWCIIYTILILKDNTNIINNNIIMKYDQYPSFHIISSLNEPIGVEIGTWEGDFSYELLQNTNCKKLYCVDPYKHFENGEYPDGMNTLSQNDFDIKYDTVKNRFKLFNERVEFCRNTSYGASTLFDNNIFDFIYIDGNHDYKYVLSDILLWWPKLKSGGWLCGDDVYSQNLEEHDKDGNVLCIWSNNPDGTSKCWGKYGTYKAVIDGKKILDYDYTIQGTQFLIQKQ